ncbi:hypothetical protein Ciccas_003876 [Cichlidogyrus casuarinus]|uniref:ARID domain-containing protein n=1 Tax=Cichlidogyrus casuarinus TaxID=1844966 RepID=A0ABD2QD73_9PLAT
MSYETASAGGASSASSGIDFPGSTDKEFPIFLPIGTAVSAKYRGAFCEAKISKCDKNFRIRVQVSNPKTTVNVDKEGYISGVLEMNMPVVVKWPLNSKGCPASENFEKKNGTILRISDLSKYTVVFDDGDTRVLKRTQLVLKSGRHFKESESLDKLPLTNPEHFKQPVIDRKRNQKSSDSSDEEANTMDETNPAILSAVIKDSPRKHKSMENVPLSQLELIKSELISSPFLRNYLGRVVMVDTPVSIGKDNLLSPNSTANSKARKGPALVCLSSAYPSLDLKAAAIQGADPDLDLSYQPAFVVKMFSNNKFSAVSVSHLKRLDRSKAVKLAHKNSSLLTAFERAILWIDRKELPSQWGADAVENLLGSPQWRLAIRSIISKLPEKFSIISAKRRALEAIKEAEKANQSKSKGSPSRPAQEATQATRKSPRSANKGQSTESETFTPTASTPIKKGKKQALESFPEQQPSSSSESDSASESESSSSSSESTLGSSSEDELATSSDDSESEGRSFEERDRWIAYLFRFMDERGTPINKAPSVGNKDLDLYKLHKVVNRAGGFHRASYQLKWGSIYSKLGLPSNFTSGPKNLQTAYKKYLYPLDDLSKKLGATNLSDNIVLVTGRSRNSAANTPVKQTEKIETALSPSPPHLTAEVPCRSPTFSPRVKKEEKKKADETEQQPKKSLSSKKKEAAKQIKEEEQSTPGKSKRVPRTKKSSK